MRQCVAAIGSTISSDSGKMKDWHNHKSLSGYGHKWSWSLCRPVTWNAHAILMRKLSLQYWVMAERSDRMWSIGEGNGNPLQCSCLKNPRGREVMGFSRQEYWSGLPFPSPVDHILSDLSTVTCPSWVAPGAWLSFIELDKAVVCVIRRLS